MKQSLKVLAFAAVAGLTACDPKDDAPRDNNNTGETRFFTTDSAKVYAFGANGDEVKLIINNKVNTSSYHYAFAVKADGSKIAFVETQVQSGNRTVKLHVANPDGSGDTVIATPPIGNVNAMRYTADGKIVFLGNSYTSSGTTPAKLYVYNESGTLETSGETHFNEMYNLDYSPARDYVARVDAYPSQKVFIYDADGDAGVPSLHHTENFAIAGGDDWVTSAKFSSDGKYVVCLHKDGGNVKIRVINVTAKTAETFNLGEGYSSYYRLASLNLSPNSSRGTVVVEGYDSDVHKKTVYYFDFEKKEVLKSYESTDYRTTARDVYPSN